MGQGLGGGQAKGAGLRGIVLLMAPSGSLSNGSQATLLRCGLREHWSKPSRPARHLPFCSQFL